LLEQLAFDNTAQKINPNPMIARMVPKMWVTSAVTNYIMTLHFASTVEGNVIGKMRIFKDSVSVLDIWKGLIAVRAKF
jgi:hypothetical protein